MRAHVSQANNFSISNLHMNTSKETKKQYGSWADQLKWIKGKNGDTKQHTRYKHNLETRHTVGIKSHTHIQKERCESNPHQKKDNVNEALMSLIAWAPLWLCLTMQTDNECCLWTCQVHIILTFFLALPTGNRTTCTQINDMSNIASVRKMFSFSYVERNVGCLLA